MLYIIHIFIYIFSEVMTNFLKCWTWIVYHQEVNNYVSNQHVLKTIKRRKCIQKMSRNMKCKLGILMSSRLNRNIQQFFNNIYVTFAKCRKCLKNDSQLWYIYFLLPLTICVCIVVSSHFYQCIYHCNKPYYYGLILHVLHGYKSTSPPTNFPFPSPWEFYVFL